MIRSCLASVFIIGFISGLVCAETFQVTCAFGDVKATIGSTGTVIEVSGAPYRLSQENWPELPYQLLTYTFPFGTCIRSVTAHADVLQEALLEAPLAPGSGVRVISDSSASIQYAPFDATHPYPTDMILWSAHGGLNPKTLLPETVLAIRVFPVQRLDQFHLRTTKLIKVTIDAEAADAEHPLVKARIDSPEPYIIVAPESFSLTLEPYIAHRAATGHAISIYSIESILSSYAGVDDAEKLRNFIRDKVETVGATFVLLAGDADMLPVRRCPQPDDMNIPSESYFADLYNAAGEFITWDHDSDGRFGEYADDLPAMDFLFDVLVSRIPASTPTELQTALEHVIQYETTTHEDDEWFGKVLFAAVDIFNLRDHNDTSGIPEGERFAEYLCNTVFSDRAIVRLYETDTYPHDAPAVADEVVTWASEGSGFLAFHCHGAPDCFYLAEGCFNHDHADALHNGNKLPVLFAFACSTAQFDNELPDGKNRNRDNESMPEHFLLNPQGGALGFVGATRVAFASGFSHQEEYELTGALEHAYFSGYRTGLKTPALMMADATRTFLEDCGITDYYDFHTILEFAQFGDPMAHIGGLLDHPEVTVSRMVWNETTGDNDRCYEPGESLSLDVTLLNTGIEATSVSTTLACDDQLVTIPVATAFYGLLKTCQNTSPDHPFAVTLDSNLSPNQLIPFTLSVFNNSELIYSEVITLFIGEGPSIDLNDWAIWWDSSNNANPDPGDELYLSIFVQNRGCETAVSADVSFSIDSPYVSDCTSQSDPWDIPAGRGSNTPFGSVHFRISDSCPDGVLLPLDVVLTASNGGPWTQAFTIQVMDRVGPALTEYNVDHRSASVGETVHIATFAADISGVTSVDAVFTAQAGGGSTLIPLFDDGAHDDSAPGDGLYGGYFIPSEPPDDYLGILRATDGLDNLRVINEALNITTIPLVESEILFVNSSADPEAYARITQALTGIGADYATWNPRFRGDPSADAIHRSQFQKLIWTYGWLNQPSVSECEVMSNFLSEGGGLLLSGWDIARNLRRAHREAWLIDNFGVEPISGDTGSNYIDGVAGDPVFDSISIRLKKLQGSEDLEPDEVHAIAPAYAGAVFRDYTEAAGAVCRDALYRKTVFLPFSLEGIRFDTDLVLLLSKALPWLDTPLQPTVTPTSEPTRSPTPSPEPTETPVTACSTTGVEITMPASVFQPGDQCFCTAIVCNGEGAALSDYPLFVILDVLGEYFWGPTFSKDFQSYLTEYPLFPQGKTIIEVIEPFPWPENAGNASGIFWYGALTNPEMTAIFGEPGFFEFGWYE